MAGFEADDPPKSSAMKSDLDEIDLGGSLEPLVGKRSMPSSTKEDRVFGNFFSLLSSDLPFVGSIDLGLDGPSSGRMSAKGSSKSESIENWTFRVDPKLD